MLSDILERIVGVLPRYGAAVWAVLCRPVAETLPRAADPRLTFDAVIFWSISAVFFIVVRLLIFNTAVDQTLYFVSRLLNEFVVIFALALSFSLAARLMRAPVPVHASLAAVALFTAAVSPVTTVIMGAVSALWLAVSPEIFNEFGRWVFSCSDGSDLARAAMDLHNSPVFGKPFVPFVLLFQMVLVLAAILIWVVYSVAFFRVIGRLGGAGRRGTVGIALVGLPIAAVALLVLETFSWATGRNLGGCAPAAGGLG